MKQKQIPKIIVTIRKRPQNKKELSKREKDVIVVKDDTIAVYEEREKVDLTKYNEVHKYKFDRVYDEKTSTQSVNLKDLRKGHCANDRSSFRRSKSDLLCLWSNREW